jgi:hypothetical protein
MRKGGAETTAPPFMNPNKSNGHADQKRTVAERTKLRGLI